MGKFVDQSKSMQSFKQQQLPNLFHLYKYDKYITLPKIIKKECDAYDGSFQQKSMKIKFLAMRLIENKQNLKP